MSSVEMLISPRMRDLGGFSVGRVLPYAKRRMVGPFIFFDEIGPADFAPGDGIDVRPHPHIGLATVTYLFDGELRHKDDLGFDQLIRPGDVNWMTAGRGIVHSERTDDETRRAGQTMHGIQSWVALPPQYEETDPAFHHHPKETLPFIERGGAEIRVIAGEAFGAISPVQTFSPIFYAAAAAASGVEIPMPETHQERALYVLRGAVDIDGEYVSAQTMAVIAEGAQPRIIAQDDCRVMLLGGAPLGPRHIWWNFVSSSEARIEQAKADWRRSAESGFENTPFGAPPGETEHIPLPDA
ncbi:MAG: pirin family protein [Pseudomonadota bacterium]